MRAIAVALVLVAIAMIVGPAQGGDAEPAFVGSTACGTCHQGEMAAWHNSHHDLAMAEATEQSVLGDFDGATFTYGDVTSRFFKRDGKFFVHTDGADGKLADFQIRYTFGFYPLQQYLIAFPDGRMQALGIAWDSRPKDKGGPRWFHLYPDQKLKAGDPVHWTGIDQTWNFQCAECHSTELRKNYDAAKDTYATTWAEIDVACEACHGPGSAHVAWAKGERSGPNGLTVQFDERKGVNWTLDPATGTAKRSHPRISAKELETCGVCHARGTKIAEPWRPGRSLLETHVPTLLYRGLFEADGKSLDEVYNYAPFRQSKMFVAGVSCSDCHDPHSLKLRAEGDGVCLQCHDGAKFAAVSHHHHAEGSAGSRCVSCHMPVKTYMEVDPRHDHAFRIPRPDESVRFGTSNACNDCHADKDAAWAAAAVERWYGPHRKGFQTWTGTFDAARTGKPEAAALLVQLALSTDAPSIARATALESLADFPSRDAVAVAQRALADPDPLVRLAALRTLRPYGAANIRPLAGRLLADPVLAVRIEAASLLADLPQERLSPQEGNRLARAIEDYVTAQRVNADRPEHRVNLGSLNLRQQRYAEAEAEFRAAARLDPAFAPATVGLAELYAQQSRDGDGERVLRTALARTPDSAELRHALGLNLVRQRRTADALPELGRAAALDPATTRYTYVYAVALNSAGRSNEAITALETAYARRPADREILLALATINRDAGHREAALRWAERLLAIDPSAQPLVEQLRQTPVR
ncbi:MAG: multiheme c-type cytochrome [Defluviicoccus sp.]|nr:multiheme c-type cytochrome [Defluviicoccus sp.]MDG4608177.1 multiheme c-type cytochrome [Defluviicoccus sp.]